MTSVSTLGERLRRASAGADPIRDAAIMLSEFVDDGGLDAVDDPFHPARRHPVTGDTAIVSRSPESTVVLVRSVGATSAGAAQRVPQCHGVPVAIALLEGRLAIDVFAEGTDDSLGAVDRTVEVRKGEVYVLDDDVIHQVRFVGDQPGLALEAALGDLESTPRARWVDGRRQIVEFSDAYPLTDTDG